MWTVLRLLCKCVSIFIYGTCMNIIHNYNVLCIRIHFIMHKHPWNDEEEGVGMRVPNGQGAIREVCLQRTVSLGEECTR